MIHYRPTGMKPICGHEGSRTSTSIEQVDCAECCKAVRSIITTKLATARMARYRARSPSEMGHQDFPYGMKPKNGDKRVMTKCFEETATISLICHRYRQGDSFNAIALWLDHSNITNRAGGKWHHEQIKRILKRAGFPK